jgi:uncharacterized LabA/DUF88 family protein/cold shock CspA family protein
MELKAGIYVDGENAMRSGGWGMRYDILKKFVEAQGGVVLRANTYLAIDVEREQRDLDYQKAKADYRAQLRRYGFKIVLKPVQRYRNPEGEIITKANADLDLAIDTILQARNLDYVVLVTGDGDFVRLVTALQNQGCRVDVLAFHNVSHHLRESADNYLSGFLVPGLMPAENGRSRGYLHTVYEDKFYGFLTLQAGLRLDDTSNDVFCHGKDVEGGGLSNREFARLKAVGATLDFDLAKDEKGRKAVNVTVLRPGADERGARTAPRAAAPGLRPADLPLPRVPAAAAPMPAEPAPRAAEPGREGDRGEALGTPGGAP